MFGVYRDLIEMVSSLALCGRVFKCREGHSQPPRQTSAEVPLIWSHSWRTVVATKVLLNIFFILCKKLTLATEIPNIQSQLSCPVGLYCCNLLRVRFQVREEGRAIHNQRIF